MLGAQPVLIAALALLLTSCVKMAYLATDVGRHYPPSTVVEILWKEPDRPFTVIGRVSASSDSRSEETLFRRIQERAAREGAHAVIVGGGSQTSSVVGAPLATGGMIIAPIERRRLEALAIRWNDRE